MTKKETINRINELKDRIFDIEIGYDVIPHHKREELDKLYAELRELENGLDKGEPRWTSLEKENKDKDGADLGDSVKSDKG